MSLADAPRDGMTRRESCLKASAAAALLARPVAERLAEKTQPEPNSGCLLWLGAVGRNGYGKILRGGRVVSAHRAAYEIVAGPTPLHVLHRCDNRLCVNPDHLFPGTPQDNMDDCRAKGRTARGERVANAKFTEEQVRLIRSAVAAGGNQRRLAKILGVSAAAICNVVRRKSWSHLP